LSLGSRLRTGLGPAAAALGLLLPLAGAPGPAQAQMTSTTGSGTCSGSIDNKMIAGTTSISIGTGDEQTLVPVAQAGAIFSRAECECRSRDVFMHIVLTSPAPVASNFGLGMYIGDADCAKLSYRNSTSPSCDPAAMPSDQSFRRTAPFDVALPSEVVTQPRPKAQDPMTWMYSCADTNGPQQRTATITLGPDSDAPASCTLPLAVNTRPPTAEVTINSITSGNGALGVNWSVPEGTVGIDSYQVLCRKKSDPKTPVRDEGFLTSQRYWFSSCLDGVLYRRPVPGRDKNMRVERAGFTTSQRLDFPLDPRFICSGRIMATTNSLNTRIDGLVNQEVYQVMVVAIDTYGNAKPSALMEGTPLVTQNPLESFCDDKGNCPTGFGCSVGQAPSRSAVPTFGLFLLWLLGLFGLRRARRQRAAQPVRGSR
jgi:MYXO-CTERM domain-containing protein